MNPVHTPTTLVTAKGRLYVTADERKRFVEAVRTYPDTPLATFAATLAYTGCRISEALAARLEDVDLTNHTIRFRTLKRRHETWREVPLPEAHVRELELVHKLRARQRTHHTGERLWPIGRSTASRHIAALMAAAGITGPQACAKGLRHGYAIAAIEANVPLSTIADVLGHADTNTTAIYARATGREAREFIARMWNDN